MVKFNSSAEFVYNTGRLYLIILVHSEVAQSWQGL